MSSLERSVLLVVEGEKAEKDLVEAMFAAFNPKATWYVHPYRTVVYELIQKIVNDYDGDYDNIEIVNVLTEMLPENERSKREKLLYTKFTDVILMFDFDPQDNRFDPIELRKMMASFSDSTNTDRGLLLLNYPAVESVKEAAALGYDEFAHSFSFVASKESYKTEVNGLLAHRRGRFNNFKDYGARAFTQSIAWTVGKIQFLMLKRPIEQTFPYSKTSGLAEACQGVSRLDVLDYQINEYEKRRRVATCGTGPFFISIWKKALDGSWKAFFGN